ncbi:hypothetical protein [Streptomyces sp. NPDC018045]|uniref:hypothetical protein n=1 Tax=Streptomyces sp. NPDC018045 TaxID=3365037 RepID=UPI003797EB2F
MGTRGRPDGADYAMPSFISSDATAADTAAQEAGARVEYGPEATPDGLVLSRLLAPRGNRFGLFSMPTGS